MSKNGERTTSQHGAVSINREAARWIRKRALEAHDRIIAMAHDASPAEQKIIIKSLQLVRPIINALNTAEIPGPLFPLGARVITPGAMGKCSALEISAALVSHQAGDWGDLAEDDKQINDKAVGSWERILSAYKTEAGIKFWVITERDRHATTVLLPEDY